MSESNWLLFLEYLKVILSWPPITLVIAITFIRMFQPAINGLIGRITEGNIFGQTIKAAPPSQSIEATNREDFLTTKAAEPQPPADTQPIVNAPLPPELANDPNAPAAIEWVKNNPVLTVIEYKRLAINLDFERLFNIMYGTQISLLEFLAARPAESIPLIQLLQFHLAYLSKPGSVAYSQTDYINFLVNRGLIAEGATPHQQTYTITPHGIQFLAYIKVNYPLGWYQRAF